MLLAKLYEAFPVRIRISTKDLGDEADETKARVYYDTALFLAREDFIRFESTVNRAFLDDVVLTAKGLAILNSEPESLKAHRSRGEMMVDAAKGASKETARTVVESFISAAVAGIVRGAGGG